MHPSFKLVYTCLCVNTKGGQRLGRLYAGSLIGEEKDLSRLWWNKINQFPQYNSESLSEGMIRNAAAAER